ncbi:MAG TPA: hypothetical protein VGN59_09880 [Acidimicrobiia bacterium]
MEHQRHLRRHRPEARSYFTRATAAGREDEGTLSMYIGIGTLVVILLIVLIVAFARRA